MSKKLSLLALCLALFLCICWPGTTYAAAAVIPLQGVIGTVVTVSNLVAGQGYLVTLDSIAVTSGTAPTGGVVTFSVLETVGGAHSLIVENPVGTQVFNSTFTVIPSIVISPTTGTVGTTVSVNGKGFAASETGLAVTYDSTSVVSSITASGVGSWSTTFALPASASGSHLVGASGITTAATSVTNVTFTTTPSISISPTSGGVGTTVTVTGSGFAASEASISVTYDAAAVSSGIVAGANGTWSATFAVPISRGGNHMIDAAGSTTAATAVTDVSFSVTAGIAIDRDSGRVGDSINITGSGFVQGESGIVVTFDGVALGASIVADTDGRWSAARTIPAAANGAHSIGVYGATTAGIANKTITISAQVLLNPASGNVGDVVAVTGNGFTRGSTVSVSYGGTPVIPSVPTDNAGSFSSSFRTPGGKSGSITVTVIDASTIAASVTFAMETTPPPVPQIVSPKSGSTVGFVGDAKVTFDWTDVTDPSGVTYSLQVSSKLDFAQNIIQQSNLTVSQYATTDTESLPHGDYYWRVRAIDGAGNASAWIEPAKVKAGVMSVTTLLIIIGVVVVLLIGLRFYVILLR